MPFRFFGIVILLLILLTGCRVWDNRTETSSFKLPSPALPVDSASVDLTFVRIPSNEPDLTQTIWAEVDEQCISPDLRSHLNSNGVRCGVLGQRLPSGLRRQLESASEHFASSDIRKTDVLTRARHQRWKHGKRIQIVSTALFDSKVLLHRQSQGDNGIRGQTLSNVQGYVVAKAYPQASGRVRIELTPEFQFGDMRQQWVSDNGTFQVQSGKERRTLTDLAMDFELSPGQSILVGCTPKQSGIGESLFVDNENGDSQQRLLFIRVAQSRKDELFDKLVSKDVETISEPDKKRAF